MLFLHLKIPENSFSFLLFCLNHMKPGFNVVMKTGSRLHFPFLMPVPEHIFQLEPGEQTSRKNEIVLGAYCLPNLFPKRVL